MSFFIDKNNAPASDTSVIQLNEEGEEFSNEQKRSLQFGLHVRSSSLIKFYPNCCTCFDTTALRYPNETATCRDKLAYFFQCPPTGAFPRILSFLVTFIVSWIILYLLIGEWAGFRGPIFAIVILEIIGLFSGMGMRILGFPALLAPLAIGIMIRNIDILDEYVFKTFAYPFMDSRLCMEMLHLEISNLTKNEIVTCCSKYQLKATTHWIDPIREIALTLILTRAGLELSPKQLKKLKGVVPMLAFVPCIVEALVCAALFFAFFNELQPSIWMCFVSGFALSAVSPAVVVPGIMSLKKRGYGVSKGVPTLLIASSSIDDVLAITLYTIFLSIAVSEFEPRSTTLNCPNFHSRGSSSSTHEIQHGHVARIIASIGGIPLGILHGAIFGCFLHFIPSRDSNSKGMQRLVLIILFNICTMLGYERTKILNGAGSIGVLVTSFVASFGWRSQPHWKQTFTKVEHILSHIWTIFVPILFGTIGKEIRFVLEEEENDPYRVRGNLTTRDKELEMKYWNPFSKNCIGRIIGIILISLTVRSVMSFLVAGMAKLNIKERLFVVVAWLPKATVQAALAPIVLSQVLEHAHNVPMMCIAKLIVCMAVLGIVFSAPVGAIAITFLGPRLLTKEVKNTEIDEEFPNGDDPSVGDTEFSKPASRTSIFSANDNPSMDNSNNIQLAPITVEGE